MNRTLFLAEEILRVLQDSNQTLESQIAASEIAVKLLKAEPYGSLAQVSHDGARYSGPSQGAVSLLLGFSPVILWRALNCVGRSQTFFGSSGIIQKT